MMAHLAPIRAITVGEQGKKTGVTRLAMVYNIGAS
jgi:hypothetical protein